MEVELSISFNDVQHTFSVAAQCSEHLKRQRECFLRSLNHPSEAKLPEPSSAAELVLRYLHFIHKNEAPQSVVQALLLTIERDFLFGTDAHSLISKLQIDATLRRELIRAYYSATSARETVTYPKSALVEAAEQGNAHLFAIFGGQGTTTLTCVRDLIDLFTTYAPLLEDLICAVGPLLNELCHSPNTKGHYYGRAIDLNAWLYDPSAKPDARFASTAAVSVPIIGLLSLAHYCVACKILGKSPGGLRSLLRGLTGHSQGIVVAATVALSDSWDSFYDAAKLAMEVLFWLGYECHQAAPHSSVSAAFVQESLNAGEGQPSCMLSVRGLGHLQLETIVAEFNSDMPDTNRLYIALTNARDNFVVAGPASSLVYLATHLRALKADAGLDQSRIPFSARKPAIHQQFLPISTPFHTPYLSDAADAVKLHLSHISISAAQLLLPVYHSRTGDDIRDSCALNLIDDLVDAIACEQCDWPMAVTFPNATHIIAFGGGGVGELTMKVKDGEGVRMLITSELEARGRELGTAADLYSPQLLESSTKIESWGKRFRPRLTQSALGKWQMETRLSRLLGTPPVIVAGMTPTTAHWDFVSAIMKAGYHVELAGGGYHNADAMSSAITQLVDSVPAGRGVTCNLIYASPHTMAWQISLLRKLARNGTPVDGLTIGAGVPSPEIVSEYIETLDLKHISFKPGSSAAIREVIAIAKAHANFPIILQWTGGRGGGHHSFEDFHAPILGLYGAIRQCSNIVLVAGSGFGGGTDTYPYLTGAWATRFGRPLMPFDGVLLGSRMMVAREAHTSLASKKLICEASGVSDLEWEKSYKSSTGAGGIVTVQSEMGQPIHKIGNRGVLLWAEMDKLIFSLPRKERTAKLTQNRDYIISRLNADFAKPWFGLTAGGQVVDLAEMTYAEVLSRLICLMHVPTQNRWIDKTYAKFVLDFAARTLERFPVRSDFQVSASSFDRPVLALKDFLNACPGASNHLLNPEDSAYFLLRCKTRGQKPVNFIPSLDDDFEFYFKKDSLWQSEDLDAVIGQDAGRVCILHGPVAAQYSLEPDESAKDILDGIASAHVDMLRQDICAQSIASTSSSGTSSPYSWSVASSSYSGATTPMEGSPITKHSEAWSGLFAERVGQLPATIGARMSGQSSTLLRALFNSEYVLQGRQRKASPFRHLLESPGVSFHFDRESCKVVVDSDHGVDGGPLIEITFQDELTLSFGLHHPSAYKPESIILRLEYQLNSDPVLLGFRDISTHRNERIKSFYSKIWFDEDIAAGLSVNSTFQGQEMTLTKGMLQDLVSTVGLSYSHGETMLSNSDVFPISVGIIVAWDVMTKPLVLKDIDGDLLRLVHHSNTFEYCENVTPLRVGEVVKAQSHIKAIYIEEVGKYVVVEAQITRSGLPVMTVTSTFLFKGTFADFQSTFRRERERDMVLELASQLDDSILQHRNWFLPHDSAGSLVGKTLLFRLETDVKWKNKKLFKEMHVKGPVFVKLSGDELQEIGTVDFHEADCIGNPVTDFLERRGSSSALQSDLTHPGWSSDSSLEVQVPSSNERYAQLSKDYNPIHVSPVFADWAELPGTITHGMYTSAVAAGVLEHLAADGNPRRLHRFSATFTGMVLPGDQLSVSLRHIGMIQGRMRFHITAFKKGTDEKVLDAEAEVEQAKTAYIFTGQGSQGKGMGMDLYNTSPVAKAIWDDVDKYLYDAYGKFYARKKSRYVTDIIFLRVVDPRHCPQ
jgi:fatty acid synthase subunit beta, fungi type